MIDSFLAMEKIVNQTYLYTDEKITHFKAHNEVQLTLRQKIERLNKDIMEKNEKIKLLDQRLDNTAAAADDMDLLTKEISKLKANLNDAEGLVGDKDRELKAKYIQLKDMNKENRTTNEKLAKMQSIYQPRLLKAMQNVG